MTDKDQEENAAALAKMRELGIVKAPSPVTVLAASPAPWSGEPKTHEVKVQTQFWADLWNFKTTAQLRQDDRQYRVGDELLLREYNPTFGHTGNICKRRITHILRHEDVPYGIRRGWCILSTARMDERSNEDAFRAGYNRGFADARDKTGYNGDYAKAYSADDAWPIYRDAVGTT